MIIEIIASRVQAEQVAAEEIARKRRASPMAEARWRRKASKTVIAMCRRFRDTGSLEVAVRHAKVARCHLIIARAWEREAQRRAK